MRLLRSGECLKVVKKRMKWISTIMTGMLVGLAASCSSSECYENHSALPLASFYNKATLQEVSLVRLEIYGLGAPGDSILYTPQTLAQAYLPFRMWQDTTQYIFAYYGMVNDSIASLHPEKVPRDTVTFIYKPKEWFVSPECGAMYFYDMDTVAHSSFLIDSIAYNKLITNENTVNLKFYFKEEISE